MSVEEKFDNAKDKVAGKAKEVEGKVTGDKSREAQGLFGKAKDKLSDAAEAVKDSAEDAVDAVKDGVEKLKK